MGDGGEGGGGELLFPLTEGRPLFVPGSKREFLRGVLNAGRKCNGLRRAAGVCAGGILVAISLARGAQQDDF